MVRIFPTKYLLLRVVVYWGILYITGKIEIAQVRVKKKGYFMACPQDPFACFSDCIGKTDS